MLARAPAGSRAAAPVAADGGARRHPRSLSTPSNRLLANSTTTTPAMPAPLLPRRRPLAVAPRASMDDTTTSSSSASVPGMEGDGAGENGGGLGGGCPVLPFRSSSSSSSSPSPSTSSSSSSSSPSPADTDDLPLPPGSMGLPVLGENWQMLRSPSAFHRKRREKHGDIYKSKILGGPVVVIHDPKECRRLLLSDGTDSETSWPKSTRQLMGDQSILMQSGKKHAAQRRLLGQAFTREAVDGYAPLVEAAVLSNLELWASEGCVRGMAAGKDLAFEVAARALVASGGDKGEDDMSQETMEAFRNDFDLVVEGFLALPYNLGRFSAFGRALRARQRVLERIDGLIDRAVKGASSSSSSSSASSSSVASSPSDEAAAAAADNSSKKKNPNRGKNALALMLSAVDPETGERATRDELRDQILTQLFAGHETTGTTIARLLRELDQRPELLQKLRDEQARCVAEFGPALSPQAMGAMRLTDATVAETLRTWPIVNGVFRAALRDLEVKTAEGSKFRVPQGWRLLLMISSTTRESVPTAAEFGNFDPERWLTPSTAPSTSASAPGGGGGGSSSSSSSSFYAPFGAGPHICLGMGLALQELRAVLALLVRDYEWEVVDRRERWEPPMLPERGLPVLFWRRGEGDKGRERAREAARRKGLLVEEEEKALVEA